MERSAWNGGVIGGSAVRPRRRAHPRLPDATSSLAARVAFLAVVVMLAAALVATWFGRSYSAAPSSSMCIEPTAAPSAVSPSRSGSGAPESTRSSSSDVLVTSVMRTSRPGASSA